jgi:hypothetical protein
MSVRRFLAPAACALFGLCCLVWGLVASSSTSNMRVGAAFLGVLFLLLATAYLRVILPQEQAERSHASAPPHEALR